MHIGGGLSRLRSGTRTVHLAEILASTEEAVHPDQSTTPGGARMTAVVPRASRPPRAASATCAATSPSRTPPARRCATASCAPTSATPRRTIRGKRAAVVGEVPDWAELREAGRAIKAATMARLDEHLIALEEQVTARGGTVHWARDANEANAIVTRLVQATGADEVVKVKSMATQEIGLNEALEAAGIAAHETDLAELIVQLGEDKPSRTSWCRRSTRTGPRSARSSCAPCPASTRR